jgi:hypothetical protein
MALFLRIEEQTHTRVIAARPFYPAEDCRDPRHILVLFVPGPPTRRRFLTQLLVTTSHFYPQRVDIPSVNRLYN